MARGTAIAKSRIEALTDGIYAIAMTLLVLSIWMPSVPAELSPDTVLPSLVRSLCPRYLPAPSRFCADELLGGPRAALLPCRAA